MNKLLSTLGVVAFAATAAAQSVVVPQGMANSNPGTSGLTWRTTAFRFQMFYDTTHFTNQGITSPVLINRLQFRANGGATSAGGETYSGVTVQMSSSPSDWNAISTTFSTNRGTDNAVVFNGNVVCLAAAGTSPNTYIIDIPITPFLYDPTSGLDLCIEVDAPAPLPATVPSMATSSNNTHLARRLSAASQTATTGATSFFASVVLMDYTIPPGTALATKFGAGCDSREQSFYEEFGAGAFDLAGTPSTVNSIALNPVGTGYVVSSGSSNWFTPTSTPIVLTDDSLTAALPLGFTFNYPGGSTTDIKICSNGFVWLDATQTAATFSGTPELLLDSVGARFAPLWHDMNPAVGGAVHFDIDPSGNTAYATWVGVPQFNNNALLTTMQLAISSNGSAEFRYLDCANDVGLTGWSQGGGAQDGGAIDISAAIPFVTETDLPPLDLSALNRPVTNTNHNIEIRDIPANATVGALTIGFSQIAPPGTDLSGLGMPGCFLHAALDFSIGFAVTGATQGFTLPIPNDPALSGGHLYAQGISTAPLLNLAGIITSNGLDIEIGTL
jgi:hypothetical protein